MSQGKPVLLLHGLPQVFCPSDTKMTNREAISPLLLRV